MKKIFSFVGFFVLGVGLSLLLLTLYSNRVDKPKDMEQLPDVTVAANSSAIITAISGEVFIVRDGEMSEVKPGDNLLEGDMIKVVDNSYCQVQFSDRGNAKIRSNTIVWFRKLVNADKDIDIYTEILTGSMLYKVNKLSDSDSFQIESDGVIYDIQGTEFLVEKGLNRLVLAVKEGIVAVSSISNSWNSFSTTQGNEVIISDINSESIPPVAIPITEANSEIFESQMSVSDFSFISGESSELYQIEIVPDPYDASIYLNGQKISDGKFSSLFSGDQELIFIIRKRGYNDRAITVNPNVSGSMRYRIKLEPAETEESIEQNNSAESADPYLNLLLEYNSALQSISQLEALLEENSSSQANDTASIIQLQIENNQLRTDLINQKSELERLKALIFEIQQLAGE